MNVLKCPKCSNKIELVGQNELSDEFGMAPNTAARKSEDMPDPVLNFGNRLMWLRSDIEAYAEQRATERLGKLLENIERTIAALPAAERESARRLLAERSKKK